MTTEIEKEIKKKELELKDADVIYRNFECLLKEADSKFRSSEVLNKDFELKLKEQELLLKQQELLLKQQEVLLKQQEVLLKDEQVKKARLENDRYEKDTNNSQLKQQAELKRYIDESEYHNKNNEALYKAQLIKTLTQRFHVIQQLSLHFSTSRDIKKIVRLSKLMGDDISSTEEEFIELSKDTINENTRVVNMSYS